MSDFQEALNYDFITNAVEQAREQNQAHEATVLAALENARSINWAEVVLQAKIYSASPRGGAAENYLGDTIVEIHNVASQVSEAWEVDSIIKLRVAEVLDEILDGVAEEYGVTQEDVEFNGLCMEEYEVIKGLPELMDDAMAHEAFQRGDAGSFSFEGDDLEAVREKAWNLYGHEARAVGHDVFVGSAAHDVFVGSASTAHYITMNYLRDTLADMAQEMEESDEVPVISWDDLIETYDDIMERRGMFFSFHEINERVYPIEDVMCATAEEAGLMVQ